MILLSSLHKCLNKLFEQKSIMADNLTNSTEQSINPFSSSSTSKSKILLWVFIGLSAVLLIALIITSSVLMSKNSNLQTALDTSLNDINKAKEDFEKTNSELASAQADKTKLQEVIVVIKNREEYLNKLTLSGQKISDVSIKLEDAIQNQDINALQALFPQLQQEVTNYNNIITQYISFLSTNQGVLEREVRSDVTATIKAAQDTQSTLSEQITSLATIISLIQSSQPSP